MKEKNGLSAKRAVQSIFVLMILMTLIFIDAFVRWYQLLQTDIHGEPEFT